MIIAKIKNLVKNADKFDNMQFRLLIEDLVKQGGTDAQNLISALATSDAIDSLTRINLIRIMGYINSMTFLVPLRKILESDENLNLRKAAIISISKYNDSRALNMLNAALKRIDNPVLQDSISSEISRIKNDNPIIGLMPKFLNGVNDPKTFRTTLEVLKKVLSSKDAHAFIYHLNSDIPFVGDGAFEILCWRGDEAVQFSIFDYYRKKVKTVEGIEDEECYALVHLVEQLGRFLIRNPETINYILKELKELYKRVKDPAVKDIIVDIFSRNHKREVLAFLEEVYNKEPEKRLMVIEKLRGNENGVFILLYKYKNDEEMKDPLLSALLTTQKGCDYIIEIFNTFSPGMQKMILDNINRTNYRFFQKLISDFLLSNDFTQKRFALLKLAESRDFSFYNIIFDPKYEAEFLRMNVEFVSCIMVLYPIKTFRFFIQRVINIDNPRPLLRKYFTKTNLFTQAEAIITVNSADDLKNFVEKLVKFNNKDMNIEVLEGFYSIKTFDYLTLSYLQGMAEHFKLLRGQRLTPEERGVLNRIAASQMDVNAEIKEIQKSNTNINHFMEKPFPDYDLLDYIMKTYPMGFYCNREKLIERIRKTFKMVNELDAFDSIKFLLRHKKLSIYFKEEIKKSTNSANYLLKEDAQKLMDTMPQEIRAVLYFKNEVYYNYIKDQLHESLPEVTVVEGGDIKETDILILDIESMEELITENRLNTRKIYVFMKDTAQFSQVKEYKPKAFPPPFSLYKLVKALVPEILIEEEAPPAATKETEKKF